MSKFKVGDRVRVVAEWSNLRGEEGVVSDHSDIASMWLVDLGGEVLFFGHDEIELAGESTIPGLTTAELREWIADWMVCYEAAANSLVVSHEIDLDDDAWFDLRDELLAEYASRQKP